MDHERHPRLAGSRQPRSTNSIPTTTPAAIDARNNRTVLHRADGIQPPPVSADALDDRIAIVGTAGSGKTYAAKGFVERLLDSSARVAIVDPLGVWWGLRSNSDGTAPGHPVVVFGGRHADVPITAAMGAPLGRIIASEALASIVSPALRRWPQAHHSTCLSRRHCNPPPPAR